MQNPPFKIFSASLKTLVVATTIATLALAGTVQAKSYNKPCTSAPENQWLSKQELQTRIKALGYNVQKVELEKGCAKFYVFDNNGGKTKLYVDPTNGQIVDQMGAAKAKSLKKPCTSSPESQWLSKQELQTRITALGYNVQKVKLEKGCAEFYVLDNNGDKIELYVDPTNGQIVDQIQKSARQ